MKHACFTRWNKKTSSPTPRTHSHTLRPIPPTIPPTTTSPPSHLSHLLRSGAKECFRNQCGPRAGGRGCTGMAVAPPANCPTPRPKKEKRSRSKEGKSLLATTKYRARHSLASPSRALRCAAPPRAHATPRHAAAAHARPRSSRVPTRPSCSPGAVASALARAATPRHGSQPRVCARAQPILQRAI